MLYLILCLAKIGCLTSCCCCKYSDEIIEEDRIPYLAPYRRNPVNTNPQFIMPILPITGQRSDSLTWSDRWSNRQFAI